MDRYIIEYWYDGQDQEVKKVKAKDHMEANKKASEFAKKKNFPEDYSVSIYKG